LDFLKDQNNLECADMVWFLASHIRCINVSSIKVAAYSKNTLYHSAVSKLQK